MLTHREVIIFQEESRFVTWIGNKLSLLFDWLLGFCYNTVLLHLSGPLIIKFLTYLDLLSSGSSLIQTSNYVVPCLSGPLFIQFPAYQAGFDWEEDLGVVKLVTLELGILKNPGWYFEQKIHKKTTWNFNNLCMLSSRITSFVFYYVINGWVQIHDFATIVI